MPTYTYTGNTQQLGVSHQNPVVAIKVDPAGTPKFTVLAQGVADVNGDFTLTWADWGGRIIIGAVDDDGATKLKPIFRDSITGTLV